MIDKLTAGVVGLIMMSLGILALALGILSYLGIWDRFIFIPLTRFQGSMPFLAGSAVLGIACFVLSRVLTRPPQQ